MVPKVLSDEQKKRRKELCLDLLQSIENVPDLLNSIIRCDETWVFMYDPETKRQSMQWNSTSPPRPLPQPPQKTGVILSNFKVMLIVFFDIQGIVMAEWVPSGQTVNPSITLKSWLNCMSVWEGNGRNYGETGGFCIRTMHCLWSNFKLIKTYCAWAPTLLVRPRSL